MTKIHSQQGGISQMPGVITTIRRKKMASASYTGVIDKVAYIGLGTGAVDANGKVIDPDPDANGLHNEIVRRAYDTAVLSDTETSYKYSLKLTEAEFVGEKINEMALYDSNNDAVAILSFSNKEKDDDIAIYSINDNY